jgi:hypothetical protein
MPDKSYLHRLADGLPDGAVASAHQTLQQLHTTREQLHEAIDTLPDAAVDRAVSIFEMITRHAGAGFVAGAGGGGGMRMAADPEMPRHQFTGQSYRGKVLTTNSMFAFRNHVIQIEERWTVAEDAASVTYVQQVVAPRRQVDRELVIPLGPAA